MAVLDNLRPAKRTTSAKSGTSASKETGRTGHTGRSRTGDSD